MDRLGDEGFTGSRPVLKPRCQVHRRPGDGVFPVGIAAGAACQHLSTGDPDVSLQRPADLAAQTAHRRVDFISRANRAFGIVVMSYRSTEHGHDRVPDVLVHAPAKFLDDGIEKTEILVQ